MARWWDLLVSKLARTSARANVAPARLPSVSRPEDVRAFSAALDPFIQLPNGTPFHMLKVYRYLRDAIPDISDAIWTWKRLCQTGHDVEILNASSDVAKARAERLVHELNQRVNSGDRGMDGLLDVFYTSLFTYGAAAFEIVLANSRESIYDIVPVDVWTVRFKRVDGLLQPFQVFDGKEIALPRDRFVYFGLDKDGTNPYGRSMLRSLPLAIKIQQQLMTDMSKAVRNAGFAKLHAQYTPDPQQRGESPEAYQQRIDRHLEQLREHIGGLETDQNLVTSGEVNINLLRGETNSRIFYDNHKAIEEQVITGTHLMPILLGRNYGTTETYGTAQFEIINRHVDAINRGVKRFLERIYNFELSLMWGYAEASVHMRTNRTVDVLKEAQARSLEIANAIQLRNEGFLSQDDAAAQLNLSA